MAFPPSSGRRSSSREPVDVFLRFVIPYVFEEGNLKLPDMFSLKHGEKLSSTVTISLPDGAQYSIGLKKESRVRMYFVDGWADLMAAQSIGLYYFLMFEYLGDSSFRLIRMFDRSCCTALLHEIGDQQDPTDPSLKENVKENHSGAAGKRNKRDLGSTSRSKMPKSAAERSFRNEGDVSRQLLDELKAQGTITWKLNFELASLTDNSKRLAMETMNRKLQHPSFLDVINSTKLVRVGLLVPSKFMKKHMPHLESTQTTEEEGILQLYGGGRRRWKVGIYVCNSGSCYLRSGFYRFAGDNSLKDGDFCLFELLEKKPCLLRVSIFHVSG
ncbi:B3 domain-containing protein REM16 [Linum perenne]